MGLAWLADQLLTRNLLAWTPEPLLHYQKLLWVMRRKWLWTVSLNSLFIRGHSGPYLFRNWSFSLFFKCWKERLLMTESIFSPVPDWTRSLLFAPFLFRYSGQWLWTVSLDSTLDSWARTGLLLLSLSPISSFTVNSLTYSSFSFLSCLLSLFHLGGTILELGKVYSTLPPIGYLIRLLAFSL